MIAELTPVEKMKAPEQIAEMLLKYILGGGVSPGEKLPPERTLATQLNVTRATLREALKKLERGVSIQGRKTLPCRAWILEPQPEVVAATPCRKNVDATPSSHFFTPSGKPPSQRATMASPTPFCDGASQLPAGQLLNSG